MYKFVNLSSLNRYIKKMKFFIMAFFLNEVDMKNRYIITIKMYVRIKAVAYFDCKAKIPTRIAGISKT